MSAPTIYRTDAIGMIGDSITEGFGNTRGWCFAFSRSVRANWSSGPQMPTRATGLAPSSPRTPAVKLDPTTRQATGYQAQQYPSFFKNAAAGRKVGDISGVMSTVLAPFIAGRTTVYIVELGTNDVNVTPAATFVPQVNAIRDAIRAAPFFRALIWCSPLCAFEKHPDGANPFDLTVDGLADKESQIGTSMAAFSDCYHISWRQLRLSAFNATSNPGNASTGIYTYDGTHQTEDPTSPGLVSGESLLTNYTLQQLSFA